ncbi:forkhead box protein I2-like [Anomaloglossus baeobatrachus]|uniref:forkhead box protein I2-like n=1 Tax=Anomaloglossus baeobatrachus TaxID=238106 RepID=UPI003F5062F5
MDSFGQQASSSQLGCSYTQDFMDKEVYSVEYFTPHQQKLQDSPDPYWQAVGSDTGPLNLTGNGSRYFPSDYSDSQEQVLDLSVQHGEPELTPLKQNEIIKPGRPPYSYVDLIIMAFQNATKKKLTLHQICKYVVDNFPFYRRYEVQLRQKFKKKLHLMDCFKNVARDDCNPWKGNCWILDISNLKWKKYKSKNKPYEKLDHKSNMKSLQSDNPVRSTDGERTFSPALDFSPCFANFTSAISAMRSIWASTQLIKDFSSYKRYCAELSAYPTDNSHYFLMPRETIAQDNRPQALEFPDLLEEPWYLSTL